MAKFRPGQSGNPAGKRKGTRDKRTAVRDDLMDPKLREVALAKLKKGIEENKPWALKLYYDRVLAPLRATDQPLPLEELRDIDKKQSKAEVIMKLVADGKLTSVQASELARVLETVELERRLLALEEVSGLPK